MADNEKTAPKTFTATVHNASPGPRFFQAEGRDHTLQPGQTSPALQFSESEAANVNARVRAGEFKIKSATKAKAKEDATLKTDEASNFPGRALAEGADTPAAANPPAFPPEDGGHGGFFTPDEQGGEGDGAGDGDGGDGTDADADKPESVQSAGGGWYYGIRKGERITEPMKKDAAEEYAKEHGVSIES